MTIDFGNLLTFEIESWADLCQEAIKSGQIEEFKKHFLEYIYQTNVYSQRELDEYANKRQGAFMEQMLLENRGESYVPSW